MPRIARGLVKKLRQSVNRQSPYGNSEWQMRVSEEFGLKSTHEFRPILIKRGAAIGANATVVCEVTVGRCAMIGEGAVVNSDVAH